MADKETQPDEAGAEPVLQREPKVRRALASVKRELTDEELASPGVQKLLLDMLQRAEEENAALKPFRDKYYEADKQKGILEEKLKLHVAFEVISTAGIAVGAAAIVFAPFAWAHEPDGAIALGFGIVCTIGGIVAKVIRS